MRKIDKQGEKTGKTRKYDLEYLQMGFRFTKEESESKPLCIICHEILTNSNSKLSLLRRHLETRHPDYKDKPIEYFKRKLDVHKTCSVSSLLQVLF